MFLYLQIVYFWTAIAKLDPIWLSGDLFPSTVSPLYVTAADTLSATLGFSVFRTLASATVVLELVLPLALHLPQRWPAARLFTFVTGVSFHLGLHFSGLRIGLFSWYCVLLLFMVCPLPVSDLSQLLPASWSSVEAASTSTSASASKPFSLFGWLLGLSLQLPVACATIALIVEALPLRDAFAALEAYSAHSLHPNVSPALSIAILSALLFALWAADQLYSASSSAASWRSTLCFVAVCVLLYGAASPASPVRVADSFRDLRLEIAQAHLSVRRIPQTAAAFSDALQIDPSHVPTYGDAGLVWLAVNTTRARELFEHVIAHLDPNNLKAHSGTLSSLFSCAVLCCAVLCCAVLCCAVLFTLLSLSCFVCSSHA